MISLKTPTKSTTLELTPEKREAFTELLTQRWLDQMDLRDLETFFLNTQADYLNDYTDAELIAEVEDNTSDEEFEELINEIAG